MATYVIGDVQGCFAELEQLLDVVNFDTQQDMLWFTGDLDLHLISVAYGVRHKNPPDTFVDVLEAKDRIELIEWLRHRPLLHEDEKSGFVLAHAGLAPAWTLKEARLLAQEVEAVLRSDTPHFFLEHMYGNQPDQWDKNLSGIERWRCITNYLTRMRLCYPDGRLDLSYKGKIAGKPDELIPWFDVKDRANANVKIIFGHWAALDGKADVPHVYPLDTGCVWGNSLTAMCLEDEERFSVKCG